MREQNKAIIRSVMRNWNENNPISWDDLCTPSFVNHGRVDRALEDFKQAHARLRKAFPDGCFTIEDMVAERDRAALRYKFTGTHSGTYEGLAATGRNVTLSGMAMWRLVASRIVESWMFFDRLGLFEQVKGRATPENTGQRESRPYPQLCPWTVASLPNDVDGLWRGAVLTCQRGTSYKSRG